MSWLENLPALPGSYVLRLRLAQPADALAVGRLGIFDFPPGDYLYLGSARGPGGLRARLAHHSRVSERPHWHLDWFRPHADLLGGWLAVSGMALECAWSAALLAISGVWVSVPGFGAADCRCRCPAHLLNIRDSCMVGEIESTLCRLAPGLVKFSALPANQEISQQNRVKWVGFDPGGNIE